jgi:hypothetical protein
MGEYLEKTRFNCESGSILVQFDNYACIYKITWGDQ